MSTTTTTRGGLRIDASGLRRRVRNISNDNDDDGRGEYVYLEMKNRNNGLSFLPNTKCSLYVLLWIATLITSIYIFEHYNNKCGKISDKIIKTECKSPDYIYTPILMDHVITGMKTNRKVKSLVREAIMNGKFDLTSAYKREFYGIGIDFKNKQRLEIDINKNPNLINVYISAIIYSNQYNTRIGEIGIPLTALFYENSIDQMIIIDDTINHKSSELWEQEILFDDKLPSEQLKITDLDEITKYRYWNWDITDSIKSNLKQFLRTTNIGIWKGFEMGSKLAFHPKPKPLQILTEKEKKNNIELLLFLDTFHQLPFDDEWITNAISLFEQYPNLQVLGGFSGIIKDGKTFGDVNMNEVRSREMDKEAKVFTMSRKSNQFKQKNNKYRYFESRVNIVELMDELKETYFDKYYTSFMQKAKEAYYGGDNDGFNDDGGYDNDDDDEAVGLFSMNFLNDKDAAVFLNEDDPNYDYEKVQTGLEGIEFTIKQRFLKYYEKEIEKRLPIPAKVLKKIADKRQKCKNEILINSELYTDKEIDECQSLIKPGGQTNFDYYFIPYQQEIKSWDNINSVSSQIMIPFMFITCVRMGPIFIRRDWWFNKLLPKLQELESTMGKLDEDWLDIQISLLTWSLGGYVGLYDAQRFKFDHDDFELGLKRNKHIDEKWNQFQENHHLSKNLDYDIWNVTHLVQLNENENNQYLTQRNAIYEDNLHPTALENSRQILLTLRQFEMEFEQLFGKNNNNNNNNNKNNNRQRIIRLNKNKENTILDKNPLNSNVNGYL